MGAVCDTMCSRNDSINQIQPDTDKMKSRNIESEATSEFETSIASEVTITPSEHEGKTTTVIEEFYEAITNFHDISN